MDNQNNDYMENIPSGESAFTEQDTQQTPPTKKYIYYVESALTPANKKNNGVIIGIFILLIVLLLTGLIGLAIDMNKQMEQTGNRSIEKYWKNIFSADDKDDNFQITVSDTDTSVLDILGIDEDISTLEDGEKAVLYYDGVVKYLVGVPSEYTFLFQSPFYNSENVSGVAYAMEDNNGDFINIIVEYKRSTSMHKEYEEIVNRNNQNEVYDKSLSLKNIGKGQIVRVTKSDGKREYYGILPCDVSDTDDVIVITAIADDVDDKNSQKVIRDVGNTLECVMDLAMN